VDYYSLFLRTLQYKASLVPDLYFYGKSLDGFEVSSPSDPNLEFPLSLPQQISRVKRSIERKVAELSSDQQGTAKGDEPMSVVLMGHSVGAYILLEVIAQWQAEQLEGKSKRSPWRPVAGINLFPTVTEIAKSEKGRQLSVCLASGL
jgi:hypothetical protein